jgi:lysyl-tRNA synthetase class 1
VCASGITPSGVIHLGNLREVMTVHFVAEALRQRGWDVEHIHSWDDFDRFRKVPAGVSADFSQYIGRPVCDVPDPEGQFESYAVRYMTYFSDAIAQLGIRINYIRQSQAYRAGLYREGIKKAMASRAAIWQVLRKYQTRQGGEGAAEESGADDYYPYKPYCDQCGTDAPRITRYDGDSARGTYQCPKCGHGGDFDLNEGKINGKLVWKVDWPMRWVAKTMRRRAAATPWGRNW